ncbi:hypothetical protein Zmor_027036 [Zophobas morio]|uniref:Uncharacterized protein n=1 Tax=Zophobas morio TaxID=2755281 RepID=A0AA38HVV3_9CUCU|nr:hypothetical protein Zmor_027036 [Zophobas morio]
MLFSSTLSEIPAIRIRGRKVLTTLIVLRNTPLRRPSTTPMAVESLLDVRTALMGESSLLTAERRAHKDRSGASRSGVQGSLEAESRWMFVKDLDQRLWV